eukprot:134732_1
MHNMGWFKKCRMFVSVDNSNWMSPMIYGLQLYDIVSDINLTTEIFDAIIGDTADDGNDINDVAGKLDTFKEWCMLISGILSLCFLIIPYGLNVAYAAKIPKLVKHNPSARTWFEQYQNLFIS